MSRVLYMIMAGLLLAESLCSFGLGIVLASRLAEADSGGTASSMLNPLGFLGLMGGLLLTASVAVAFPRMEIRSWTRTIALLCFCYGAWGLMEGAPVHLQYAMPDQAGSVGALVCSLGFVVIGGVGMTILLMERRSSPDGSGGA